MKKKQADVSAKAKEHFDMVLAQYLDLLGMRGVNSEHALKIVFKPMLDRWNSGERSEALANEMLGVE